MSPDVTTAPHRLSESDRWFIHYRLVEHYIKEFEDFPSEKTVYQNVEIGDWLKRERALRQFGLGQRRVKDAKIDELDRVLAENRSIPPYLMPLILEDRKRKMGQLPAKKPQRPGRALPLKSHNRPSPPSGSIFLPPPVSKNAKGTAMSDKDRAAQELHRKKLIVRRDALTEFYTTNNKLPGRADAKTARADGVSLTWWVWDLPRDLARGDLPREDIAILSFAPWWKEVEDRAQAILAKNPPKPVEDAPPLHPAVQPISNWDSASIESVTPVLEDKKDEEPSSPHPDVLPLVDPVPAAVGTGTSTVTEEPQEEPEPAEGKAPSVETASENTAAEVEAEEAVTEKAELPDALQELIDTPDPSPEEGAPAPYHPEDRSVITVPVEILENAPVKSPTPESRLLDALRKSEEGALLQEGSALKFNLKLERGTSSAVEAATAVEALCGEFYVRAENHLGFEVVRGSAYRITASKVVSSPAKLMELLGEDGDYILARVSDPTYKGF